ncbi:acetate/propionate family kinase [Sulfurospirillum arcachonense]|uniref:acetate/propionate family kinase n=1 Tax=Sulfurospirillum arcachonense TaxID=57666 RepID=UPI0004B05F20|nr:acetate kinase [Sulfurospirillum arcachonense]
MKILVLNSGSSSIKFQLFKMEENKSIASGVIEQIGELDSSIKIKFIDLNGEVSELKRKSEIKNHLEALEIMNSLLIESKTITDLNELDGIGHRVVHGGTFSKPEIIDENVEHEIERIIPLAPLHNKAHLDGIRVIKKLCPNVKQVAVFDTAFHSTMPEYAYMYALPYEAYEKDGVRKYGFHGTSHQFVSKEAAKYLGQDINTFNAITLHLGNGASMAAIKNGKCIDTSMGLTPLEGLVMGTRSGDLDPAILFYLARKNNLSIEDLDIMLNKKSGLKGICGSNDMREVEKMAEEGDEKAQLALDMFAYRIKKYIGSYSAIIGKLDCIIFTGGIGENDIDTRLRCCADLENLGINLDFQKNNYKATEILNIGKKDSNVKILVIPTNEELEIAIQTKKLLK